MTGIEGVSTAGLATAAPERLDSVQKPDTTGLRVAYLVNQYPKGSHTFIRREIAALEQLGVSVERFSVRRCGEQLVDRADLEERDRTRVILGVSRAGLLLAVARHVLSSPARAWRALRMAVRIGWRSDRGVLRHLAYFAEACVLEEWLRAEGVPHLHAHFGTNSAAVAMLCRELGGPPFSMTVHGQEEFDKPEFLALGEKVQRSAFTATISAYSRSQIYRQTEPEHWSKVHIVRCGIDESYKRAPTPPPANRRLIYVGRLCPGKGLSFLLDAAAQLRADGVDFELALAGDGPMRPQLEQRIHELGLASSVQLLGWCDGPRVRAELEASRALVLPSFAEGLPLVLMEALGAGRPVVSSRLAGIPELVRDGECGWLVTPGDVDDLAAGLRRALDAPAELLERFGAHGNRRVLDMHDAMAEAALLRDLFARSALCPP